MSSQGTTRRVGGRTPARRAKHGRTMRGRMNWRTRAILTGAGLIALVTVWATLARAFAPDGNTTRSRFDAIIVLGSAADADGNPLPRQLADVTEGVHEYERGVAPRLILTGGPTFHGYVEAQVMARTAEAMGVPASSIFQEPRAKDTIQNACYSVRIMQAHGWRSAEVISIASHLPRAGLIFEREPLEWRTHPAPSLGPDSMFNENFLRFLEVLKTARYLVYTRWAEKCP